MGSQPDGLSRSSKAIHAPPSKSRSPGKGTVYATFHISPQTIAAIKAQADAGDKLEPIFNVDVVDGAGEVIAKIEKRLYVRKKK